jgi:agmatinase
VATDRAHPRGVAVSEDVTPAAAFHERTAGSRVELPYAGLKTFLKSDPADVADTADADAAVLGVPYDGAVSNRPGARYGPGALREASGWWAYLSGYKGGLTNMRTGQQVDYSAFSLVDCGDVPVFPMDWATTAESIAAHVATVAERGVMPVTLGGDHSCTFPAVRGFAEGAGHDTVGVVQLDAHTDTTAESPVLGEDFHGTPVHHLVEEGYTDYEHVAQVGIRGHEAPEFFAFADDTGLNLYTMSDVTARGIDDVVREAVARAADGTDAVYVTVDIDAVDPSVAPGTGTPEWGGLSADQALRAVELLGSHGTVGAIDLMEVAPTHDPTDNTRHLGAYLLVTLLERLYAE